MSLFLFFHYFISYFLIQYKPTFSYFISLSSFWFEYHLMSFHYRYRLCHISYQWIVHNHHINVSYYYHMVYATFDNDILSVRNIPCLSPQSFFQFFLFFFHIYLSSVFPFRSSPKPGQPELTEYYIYISHDHSLPKYTVSICRSSRYFIFYFCSFTT